MDQPIETVFLWSLNEAQSFKLLVWMALGHFIAEFTFMNDYTAAGRGPSGLKQATPWYYLLLAHASTHAAQVGILTGSPWLALYELSAHCLIDYLNDEGHISIHLDQMAHLFCKAVWVVMAGGHLAPGLG